MRRNGHGCVAAVDACVFYVFHYGADEYVFAVGDAVNFDFFGSGYEFADYYWVIP